MYSSVLDDFQRCKIDELFNADAIADAINSGFSSKNFAEIVVWLCEELSALYGIEESVQPLNDLQNLEMFLLELSSLLYELGCPLECLTSGPIAERFSSIENREKLLKYLARQLKCARLTALRIERETSEFQDQSNEGRILSDTLKALLGSSSEGIKSSDQLFVLLKSKVQEQLARCAVPPKPLFTASLSEAQWRRVEKINKILINDYHNRIQLLLKRLDVTIESFTWSDRIKAMEDKLHELYRSLRDSINVTSNVTSSDLLGSTSDFLEVHKASGEKERSRTATKLNKIMITEKPSDRGGRPSELRAPPPEMPPWMKQQPSFDRRGGGGGGRGSRGGGDHRGGGPQGGGRGRVYYGSGRFQNQVMNEYEAANQRYRGDVYNRGQDGSFSDYGRGFGGSYNDYSSRGGYSDQHSRSQDRRGYYRGNRY